MEIGREKHTRRDEFTYEAWTDGGKTEVTFVFVDRTFDHVDYRGADLSGRNYGTKAGLYSRDGWRLLGWINDKISDLTKRLQDDA